MSYEYGTCRPEELYDLVELANRVFRAQRPGNMGEEYPLVFEAPNAENLLVARDNGRIVGHVGLCIRDASLLGARLRVSSIGAVATDPEHRGQGIASRLMELARERSRESRASLMLISGTRGLYQRLGYVQVGTFLSYLVPAGDPEPGVSATPFEADDLPAIVRLYQSEPVRFFRPVEDWHKLVAASMLMNQPADLLVIRRGNAIVAYAGVQRPGASGLGLRGPARVREVAGSRSALAAALPGIAREYGCSGSEVVTWASDAEWRSQALARGWEWAPLPFPGRVGIIDSQRFLTAVRPLLEERASGELVVTAQGEGVRLEAGGDSVLVERPGALTALLFGGETEEAHAVPFLPERLRAAVDVVLPVPLLWYGYNYV